MPNTKAGTTPFESSNVTLFPRCSRHSHQQNLSKKTYAERQYGHTKVYCFLQTCQEGRIAPLDSFTPPMDYELLQKSNENQQRAADVNPPVYNVSVSIHRGTNAPRSCTTVQSNDCGSVIRPVTHPKPMRGGTQRGCSSPMDRSSPETQTGKTRYLRTNSRPESHGTSRFLPP